MGLVELLRELVEVETVDSRNGEVVAEIISSHLSVEPKVVERQGVKNFIFSWGESKVAFGAHYDVVPAGEWEGAFSPILKEGFLYGRGAGDMKGSLAAMVEALKGEEAGLLLVVGDEEKGGKRGMAAVAKEVVERHRPRLYIGGEPIQQGRFPAVIVGRRGVMQVKLHFRGPGGHASMASVENPVVEMAKAIVKLSRLTFEEDGLLGRTTISPTMVGSDAKAFNVIASHAWVTLDIRFTRKESREGLLQRMAELAEVEVVVDPEEYQSYPFLNEVPEEVVDILSSYGKVERTAGGGSSDARYFAALGITALDVGPTAHNIHGRGEKVSLAELEGLREAYRAFNRLWREG